MKEILKIKIERKVETEIEIGRLETINIMGKRIYIVTNEKVNKHHGDYVRSIMECEDIDTYVVEDGEEYKTMETVLKVIKDLEKKNYDKNVVLVALGGGVITDMLGVIAALYKRGVDHVNIPTTLLSQVDAAYGGKCGVNTKKTKNLIGIIKHPIKVYIDDYFLNTLGEKEYKNGIPEIIKMGMTNNRKLLKMLRTNKNTKIKIDIIKEAIKTKIEVVEKDPFEYKYRKILNYGHTFGHAVEVEGKFKEYSHGEAVSIGMIMENKINKIKDEEKVSLFEKIIKKYKLDENYKIINIKKIVEIMKSDKKNEDQKIGFVVPGKRDKVLKMEYKEEEELINILNNIYGQQGS